MSSHSGSRRAVLIALGANFGIAVAKSAAAAFTGSGTLLAEALHSFADCGNQVLLLVGMKQAKKPANASHPMGYGKEAYFWSMMVALLLFSVGGLFSIVHGFQALGHSEPVRYVLPSMAVLAVAVVLEGCALRGALKVVAVERRNASLWSWFRSTRQSELLVVVGEDVAALSGLVLAFIALGLTALTGNPIWDAIGSMAVGTLLVITAGLVLLEVKSLIVGESVPPRLRREIWGFVEKHPSVERVVQLTTLQMGDYMMVAVELKMLPTSSGQDMVDAIADLDDQMKARFTAPQLKYSFLMPREG